MKRSKLPNSCAVTPLKNSAGLKVLATASATLPASGPSERVSVDTPRFGVANPPALSELNSTPSVSATIAANGSSGLNFERSSLATSANTPVAASKLLAT